MKKVSLILLTLIVSFIFPYFLNATIVGTTIGSSINIRKEPTVESTILDTLNYGVSISLVDTTLYKGNGCNDGWYKIIYNDTEGYICSTYVSIDKDEDDEIIYYTSDYQAKVNTSSYITVKSLASYNSKSIERIITGTQVNIISEWPSGNGCKDKWYYVSYYNGKKGYVCSTYIAKKSELVLKEDDYTEEEKTYASKLIEAGFVESYIPYLMKLHRSHPNWNFVPSRNNIEWNDVISGEEWNNKIESTTVSEDVLPYYVASMVGTEGGSWYYTNDAVNAYFLDPRNFLSDPFMFIFEDLSFNEKYHTKDSIKTMFNISRPNSFLNTDEYINYFLEAGKTHSISPIHLVARVIKEGASNEEYMTVSGISEVTYNGCYLKGYYNFYNIGSTGTAGPSGGLYYAAGKECDIESTNSYGRPWKTRKDAIYGGAEFIATSYGNQKTLYFQKFNTSNKPYFTNQYMSNVMAPTQEGENIYNTYKEAEILDNNYTFVIPVYENMPDYVSLPSLANTDNTLSNIKINNKTLENFDTDVLEYVHYVTKDIDEIELTATPTVTSSTVKNTGKITLTDEKTQVNIIVTAESGDEKTYIVNIIKVEAVTSIQDILSKLSVKVNDIYMNNIKEGTSANDLITSIRKVDPLSKIVYKDEKGNNLVHSTILATNQTLTITSANTETKTFKIVITGDTSGDGKVTILDLLRVQKHILGSATLTDSYKEAADTNKDNKITILDLLRVQKHILGDIEL